MWCQSCKGWDQPWGSVVTLRRGGDHHGRKVQLKLLRTHVFSPTPSFCLYDGVFPPQLLWCGWLGQVTTCLQMVTNRENCLWLHVCLCMI